MEGLRIPGKQTVLHKGCPPLQNGPKDLEVYPYTLNDLGVPIFSVETTEPIQKQGVLSFQILQFCLIFVFLKHFSIENFRISNC